MQIGQRGDGVLLLLRRWHGRHDEAVELLMALAVAVHQAHQLFDIAGTDVDHHVIDGLQVLLQFAELKAAQ